MTGPRKGPCRETDAVLIVLQGILQDIKLNHITSYYACSLNKDCEVILRRFKTRGMPFLTKELPSLGKALDSALVTGTFVIPPQFRRMSGTALPRTLFVLWSKVFDLDGRLRKSPSLSAIVDLRFMATAFYKYEMEFDQTTVDSVVQQFIETDKTGPKVLPTKGPLFAVLDVAHTLIAEVLGSPPDHFIPRHSSGAVSTGERPWEKTRGLTAHLNYRVLGGLSNFYVNPRESYYLGPIVGREVLGWPIAKLVPVPKDSRGPRLICEEPVTQQFLQQGIKDHLYDRIEKHPLTCGHVNFTDQTINQKLALLGSSVEPGTVTLDMKEASDRIFETVVRRLFPERWMRLFDATRTELVELPNGSLLPIEKYAPMGSALCFPIESLVHWALCCATYLLAGYSWKTVQSSIYVYGDDIVLRSLPPGMVFKIFPYFGLKFNEAKSCCEGEFRESCGVDAFKGENISTLKFKKRIPVSSGNPECFAAWVEYSNLAFESGFYSTAKAIEDHLGTYRKFPIVRPNADALGYTSKRPYGLRPFLGITKFLTRKPIASAMDDRSPLYRCKALTPERPREEQVCDRSRYFETHLELARRQRQQTSSPMMEPISTSYAKKYSVRFKNVLSKAVVAI